MSKIAFGEKYRDKATGFEGVVTGRHEYEYGCVRYTLETLKDSEIKSEVFDEQRLELVYSPDKKVTLTPRATSGGPHGPVPTRSIPRR